jgi:hypothetical protein
MAFTDEKTHESIAKNEKCLHELKFGEFIYPYHPE